MLLIQPRTGLTTYMLGNKVTFTNILTTEISGTYFLIFCIHAYITICDRKGTHVYEVYILYVAYVYTYVCIVTTCCFKNILRCHVLRISDIVMYT